MADHTCQGDPCEVCGGFLIPERFLPLLLCWRIFEGPTYAIPFGEADQPIIVQG